MTHESMPDPKRPTKNPNPNLNPNPKRPTTPCIQDNSLQHGNWILDRRLQECQNFSFYMPWPIESEKLALVRYFSIYYYFIVAYAIDYSRSLAILEGPGPLTLWRAPRPDCPSSPGSASACQCTGTRQWRAQNPVTQPWCYEALYFQCNTFLNLKANVLWNVDVQTLKPRSYLGQVGWYMFVADWQALHHL